MQAEEINESIPVACQIGAVPEAEREQWMATGRELYSSVRRIVELADGYALELSPEQLDLAGRYVMRDRLCCAFVRWEIVVEQRGGPAWLNIRGPRGTKEFVAAALECTDMLPLEVAREAGLNLSRRRPVTLDDVAALADELNAPS